MRLDNLVATENSSLDINTKHSIRYFIFNGKSTTGSLYSVGKKMAP